MNEQEKQKIKKDFEERFPNADSEVKSYGEYCALRGWLLETIDKAIKSKLEAVEGEILEFREATRNDGYGQYVATIDECIDIINKHK